MKRILAVLMFLALAVFAVTALTPLEVVLGYAVHVVQLVSLAIFVAAIVAVLVMATPLLFYRVRWFLAVAVTYLIAGFTLIARFVITSTTTITTVTISALYGILTDKPYGKQKRSVGISPHLVLGFRSQRQTIIGPAPGFA